MLRTRWYKPCRVRMYLNMQSSPREARVLFVVTAAFLWGCVTLPAIRPLTEEQWESSALRGKSVALYRIAAEIGTESVTHPPYRLELANMATNELSSLHVFSPSQESSNEGWGYFLIEPGRYRLSLTFLFFGYPSADFQLSVQSEQSIMYLGSLSIHCRRERAFLVTLTTDCTDIIVSNESPAAEMLAAGSFGSTRPTLTRLLRVFHER